MHPAFAVVNVKIKCFSWRNAAEVDLILYAVIAFAVKMADITPVRMSITLNYELTICSDTSYQELVAEIHFANGEIVVVSQERSFDKFEISFYSRYQDSGELVAAPLTIDLDAFFVALAEAKQKLNVLGNRRYDLNSQF